MDEEQSMNTQKKQKKIKQKTVNSEKYNCITMEEANIIGNKGDECAQTFQEVAVLERNKQKEKDKEKKRNKKLCGAGDIDMEKNAAPCLSDGDCKVDATSNNEMKKTKKIKKKREDSSIHEVMKNQKNDDGVKGGEKREKAKVEISNVNREGNVEQDWRKKRKRETKKNKDNDGIGWQDTHSASILGSELDEKTSGKTVDIESEGEKTFSTLHEGPSDDPSQKIEKKKKKMLRNKDDESNISLQKQENMLENVDGSVKSASGDGKKKKKSKKNGNFADCPSVGPEDIDMQHSADEPHCTEGEDANKRKKKKAKMWRIIQMIIHLTKVRRK